jgi:hypothetical protein
MKKSILFLILFVSVINLSFGQFKENDLKLSISGLPLIGSSDAFGSGINGFAIKPSIGYFITENTSIDINFSYASLNDLSIDEVDSYYNSYAFVPTLRNNFVNKEKLRVFGEIGFGLGTIKYDANNSVQRTASHRDLSGGISILNIGIGFNYFFNEQFGLEFVLPYINSKNITSEAVNTLYSGVGPSFGFIYVIN